MLIDKVVFAFARAVFVVLRLRLIDGCSCRFYNVTTEFQVNFKLWKLAAV